MAADFSAGISQARGAARATLAARLRSSSRHGPTGLGSVLPAGPAARGVMKQHRARSAGGSEEFALNRILHPGESPGAPAPLPPAQLLGLDAGPGCRCGCAASERSGCQNRSKSPKSGIGVERRRRPRDGGRRRGSREEKREGEWRGGREGLVSKPNSSSVPAEQISSVYFISLVEPL